MKTGYWLIVSLQLLWLGVWPNIKLDKTGLDTIATTLVEYVW